jgi:hypothetical protein
MEQITMEQFTELLKVQIGGLASKIDKLDAERKADKAETKANQEGMMAEIKATIKSGHEEMIKSITGASRESTEACEEKTKALLEMTEACPEVTPACLEEEKEQAPERTEAMEKSWEVPEGAADEEKFRATEDRAGELRLAVRRHRQRKKRAQENGGPWQKFAAFCGRFTCRTVPALLKGHVRKGPRRNRRSGVRGPGKTFRRRIDGRSLKQRQIKGNVARETPTEQMCEKKRRTHPECNSGIRRLSKISSNRRGGRSEKLGQRLEAKRMHREIIRRSLRLEVAKLMIMSFIGIREPGNGTLWKGRPPLKRKR